MIFHLMKLSYFRFKKVGYIAGVVQPVKVGKEMGVNSLVVLLPGSPAPPAFGAAAGREPGSPAVCSDRSAHTCR